MASILSGLDADWVAGIEWVNVDVGQSQESKNEPKGETIWTGVQVQFGTAA
jgi:hypothetical protein